MITKKTEVFLHKTNFFIKKQVENITKFNENIAKNYKLNLHSPAIMKKSENFVKYYSGGPIQSQIPDEVIIILCEDLVFIKRK